MYVCVHCSSVCGGGGCEVGKPPQHAHCEQMVIKKKKVCDVQAMLLCARSPVQV